MTNAKEIKQMAESIRKTLTGKHYYDKKIWRLESVRPLAGIRGRELP